MRARSNGTKHANGAKLTTENTEYTEDGLGFRKDRSAFNKIVAGGVDPGGSGRVPAGVSAPSYNRKIRPQFL